MKNSTQVHLPYAQSLGYPPRKWYGRKTFSPPPRIFSARLPPPLISNTLSREVLLFQI
ncbi:hypothetical protein [Chryseobacterium arthrosphaerae]|uniref:hypothetical protein n=1 Tax=Chryseobacterium arthrosphaerae TaxID=651561 RepID=UPI001F4BECB6|nr:hypothetical protein [Chryseobacterium arthrosphaerae]